jgi:GNAT superfamily N-acetyltransferase
MEPSVVSRQGTHQDIDAILDTLVVAFANDPIWGGWAFPERERAAEQRRAFFELWLLGSLRYQTVHVTPGCEAVALWYPPGQFENTADDERDLVATARAVLGPRADRFLEGCAVIEDVHPRHEPHYYLSMLGTHDRHRGRGLGMALLRDNLGRIDALGMPAYLDSTDPGNNPRYERLGFTRIGEYSMPGGGPVVTQMWRKPR